MTLYDVSWVNADGIRVSRTIEVKNAIAAAMWLANNATNMVGATMLPTKSAGAIADKLQVWVPECQRASAKGAA